MFEEFDINTVLAEPTVERSEQPTEKVLDDTSISGLEFEPLQPHEEVVTDEGTEIDLFPYDPKENAEQLIELIDSINIAALTPLARWKLAKKRGGKDKIRKMQLLAAKKLNGGKLTEEEERQYDIYTLYLEDKKQLENAIPYTDEEKEKLIKSATLYLQKAKIKIGGGAAFWTELAIIQGSRVLDILSA